MCKKAVVFAGTTEGRKIAEYLSRSGVDTIACTATGYGGELLEENDHLRVYSGRMDKAQIRVCLGQEQPRITVDATHPYAAEATANIRIACEECGCKYLRINRECGKLQKGSGQQESDPDIIYADSVAAAVEYLSCTEGNILISTGSKELLKFTGLKQYKNRCYARVLSLPDIVSACAEMGFAPSHLFAMQGPFSTDMNLAMLKQVNASYFVTKESGSTGGFEEKYAAARSCGAVLVVVGRPQQEEGLDLAEGLKYLNQMFHIAPKQKIVLAGIGMGAGGSMTEEVRKELQCADLIIGAKRMLEAVCVGMKKRLPAVFAAYDPVVISDYLREHPQYQHVTVALSGDVGFYSGAKKLMETLTGEITLLPGVSSLPYFAARLKTSWEDVKCASLHGRNDDVIGCTAHYPKVFVLLSKKEDAAALCRKLTYYGFGNANVTVGENLSYENEHIHSDYAQNWQDRETQPLSVCLIEREDVLHQRITSGIPDDTFARAKVPMTKEEVRSIVLSKLRLTKQFVLWDIGAGTGSVSVEAARLSEEGRVYAIEKNPEGIELIQENCRRFAADNVYSILGTAPNALKDLPMPTHGFIGGSSGNLKEITAVLLRRNPFVRIVITAVSMETTAEAFALCKEIAAEDFDIATISVSKSKELGSYHMMLGQNPVTVFSFTGGTL